MHLTAPLSALLSSGAIIDVDGTLFIQFAFFFLLFFLLRRLVFKPLMAVFEAREKAIDGARDEARTLESKAKDKADSFDEEMRQVRVDAQEERDRLRADGLLLEKSLLEKVRLEAQETLNRANEKMDAEAKKARTEIGTAVPRMAQQIAEKVLGRGV